MACPMGFGDKAQAQKDTAAFQHALGKDANKLPASLSALLDTFKRQIPDCGEPHRLLNKCYRRVATEDPTGHCLPETKCFLACDRARTSVLAGLRESCGNSVAHGMLPRQVLLSYSHCVANAAARTDSDELQRQSEDACLKAAKMFLECATNYTGNPANCPAAAAHTKSR